MLKHFAILPARLFINLAKTFALSDCGRACARSSVIEVFTSGVSTFFAQLHQGLVLYFVEILIIKCAYTYSNFGPNGSPDQSFPITFSKKDNRIYNQKVAFLNKL